MSSRLLPVGDFVHADNPNNIVALLLGHCTPLPLIGRPAAMLQSLYLAVWRWRPHLIDKLSNFLPIGALCTVLQAAILFGLKAYGVSTPIATITAITTSVFANYVANQMITWRERFTALSLHQRLVWFVPLFLIYAAATPTVYLKTWGIIMLEQRYGLPVVVTWPIFEVVGVILNFLGADKISFGIVVRLLAHLDAHRMKAAQPAHVPAGTSLLAGRSTAIHPAAARPPHRRITTIDRFLDRYLWLAITAGAIVAVVIAFMYYYGHNLTLVYGDGVTKLNNGRRIFDNPMNDFSLVQSGSIWLPAQSLLIAMTAWISMDFYRTGIPGSVWSMFSFVLATVLLYKLVVTVTGSKLGGLTASITTASNLNHLYFATTPMTESLVIASSVLAVYCLARYEQELSDQWLRRSALALAFSCLVRYEMWFIAIVGVGCVGLLLVVRRARRDRWMCDVSILSFVPGW